MARLNNRVAVITGGGSTLGVSAYVTSKHASDESDYVTGGQFTVDGGQSAL